MLNVFSSAPEGGERVGLYFMNLWVIIQDYNHIMRIFNQSLKIVSKMELETALSIYCWHCYENTQEMEKGTLVPVF